MKQTVEEAANNYLQKILEASDFEINFAEDNYDAGARDALLDVTERAYIAGAEWQAKQLPWISVEERLPENEDRVLVLCKMKRFNSYFTLLNNYIDGEWETKTLAYYDTIAWMPIPSFDEILEANKDVLERIKEKGD